MHLFLNDILPFIIGAVLLGIEIVVLRRLYRINRKPPKGKPVSISDLSTITTGQKIEVNSFEATVVETDSFNGTVKVRDANANVHYLDASQLTKVLPYEDGATYLDSYNDLYTWVAADQAWLNRAGNSRAFDYPVRPMRKYVLSATQLSD